MIKWIQFSPVFSLDSQILALLRCLSGNLSCCSSALLRAVTRIIVAALNGVEQKVSDTLSPRL